MPALRQLLSARKSTEGYGIVSYRIISYRIVGVLLTVDDDIHLEIMQTCYHKFLSEKSILACCDLLVLNGTVNIDDKGQRSKSLWLLQPLVSVMSRKS